jgi:MerR family redox-sensitive transcriptional activator SoxR
LLRVGSIDGEQALASLPQGRTPNFDDWRKLSMRWRAELESRIERLIQLRDRLDDCIGYGCLSVTTCPLRNPDDTLGRKGAGPRLLEQG